MNFSSMGRFVSENLVQQLMINLKSIWQLKFYQNFFEQLKEQVARADVHYNIFDILI